MPLQLNALLLTCSPQHRQCYHPSKFQPSDQATGTACVTAVHMCADQTILQDIAHGAALHFAVLLLSFPGLLHELCI
jgi:hypothetical protein